jgi:hypothetical protein
MLLSVEQWTQAPQANALRLYKDDITKLRAWAKAVSGAPEDQDLQVNVVLREGGEVPPALCGLQVMRDMLHLARGGTVGSLPAPLPAEAMAVWHNTVWAALTQCDLSSCV